MTVTDNPREYTWGKRKRKTLVWVGISLGIIVVLVVAGYFVFRSTDATPATNNSTTNSDTATTTRRALDGVVVPIAEANVFPWAVMIENLVTTRPQAGLSSAGVVYEALAEGGITRFMAVFATNESIGAIGPVRSARPYYVDWAREYDAMYVHVGGSPQGLARIEELGIKDFNQFFHSGAFKIPAGKFAPHHIFTDSSLLTFGARDEGYAETGSFTPWVFKDEEKLSNRPEGDISLTLDFSAYNYEVKFVYDRESNTYKRFQTDTPFTDENTGVQIAPKNVIVQFVSVSNFDAERLDITTVGTGKAQMYRDGVEIVGTWKKDTASARTLFYDAQGDQVELNAGQTWVAVLPKDMNNFTYTTPATADN